MPGRKRWRWIGGPPPIRFFGPPGAEGVITLTLEEFEAIKLADFEEKTQKEAAESMGISQPTFNRILKEGRRKIARALVEGKRIEIEGGYVRVEGSSLKRYTCPFCGYSWEFPEKLGKPRKCPRCGKELQG